MTEKHKSTVYFTADLHLNHSNVIKYCNRPFADVEEMNEAIIERWNKTVQHNDLIYVLGDFTMSHNAERIIAFGKRLHGNKHFIRGNHDSHVQDGVFKRAGFQSVTDRRMIKVHEPSYVQHIVLDHYAPRVWNLSHYGSWALYGHSHGTLPDDPNSLSLDVGVDCWDFTPVSYEQIKARMALKTFKPIDHHTPRAD